MAMISSLAGQIITVLCVAALLEQLIPAGGSTLRYVRVFTGLFILVSLLNPLTLSFNLWEQSLQQLDGAYEEMGDSIKETTDKKLLQTIQLPESLVINLPSKTGTAVVNAELILENQQLTNINIKLKKSENTSDEIPEQWSPQEQEALRFALSQVLGIKIKVEQINLVQP